MTKKGEASESEGGESEAICGGRSPLGRGGAGCYNYGHGHDDHYHDGAAVHPFLVVVDDFVDDDDDDAYQQVGSWSTEAGLDIKDIVWPNESRVPPKVRNVVKKYP